MNSLCFSLCPQAGDLTQDMLVKFRFTSINLFLRELTFQFQVSSKRRWQNVPRYLLTFKLKAENSLQKLCSRLFIITIYQLEFLINSVQCESKSHFVAIFVKYMGYLLTLYGSFSTFL